MATDLMFEIQAAQADMVRTLQKRIHILVMEAAETTDDEELQTLKTSIERLRAILLSEVDVLKMLLAVGSGAPTKRSADTSDDPPAKRPPKTEFSFGGPEFGGTRCEGFGAGAKAGSGPGFA